MAVIGLIGLLFWSAATLPTSPRIERLRAEALNDPAAESRFWQEIAANGAPLIEPSRPGQSLVTFVYRGTPETRTVVVLGDGTPGAPSDNQLTRAPGTNVWHRTYIHRADARFRYSLSPNDDLRPMETVPPADFAQRMSTFIADPLNPNRAGGPVPMSDLSLPAAPPQPYLAGPAPPVEKRPFGDLTIHIYRPADATGPLPLLILYDGSSYATELRAPTTVGNLVLANRIRPVMLAMVENAPGKRNADLTCNDAFTARIATELIPWLRANYAIAAEPVAIGGMSYGGLAASFAALRYPQVFGAVVSQSGSYWWRPRDAAKWEWLTDQYRAAPPSAVRFYLEVGQMEIGTPGGRTSMLESNRRLRDLLRARSAAVHYHEFNGDHTALNWRGGFAEALIALFPRN